MRFTKVEFQNGSKGMWVLPFLGFDWRTGKIRIWCGWIYWMVLIEFSEEE
jgi:hypothetical protein